MTQHIADLGEIGTTGALLTPLDLPILRNGATWDLTNYATPTISVWDLRTRALVASPGTCAIQAPPDEGVIRWTPTAANFPSGAYEARFTVTGPGGPEVSGLFRFSVAALGT